MSTTSDGRKAEKLVAGELKKLGHKKIQLNWRTRWCEIDIVSQKGDCVYFTEVKYRKNNAWGDGLDYITPKKLQQMQYAAEFWISEQDWMGESCLQAAAVDSTSSIKIIGIN